MAPYVGVGVRTDVRKIVERFGKLNTMRYDAFAGIWREMKFSFIYFGHSNFEELLEFTEEVLRISKDVWLKSEALNELAGGLYTIYGLYLKQPTNGLVKVRLTPRDIDLVKKFHDAVRTGGHHDANYILARMYMMGAFRFCISDCSYGIEKCVRNYHEHDRSLLEVEDEPLYVQRLKNDAVFLKLRDAFKEYHESKCKLVSKTSKNPPQLLNYVDPQFSESLKEKFQQITRINDDESSELQAYERENDQNSSGVKTNDKPLGSNDPKFELPWWMLPLKKRNVRESSSESEPDDAEDTNASLDKRKYSKQDVHEALNASLGMPGDGGDEDDDDDDDDEEEEEEVNVRSEQYDNSEPGCSYDMPMIL